GSPLHPTLSPWGEGRVKGRPRRARISTHLLQPRPSTGDRWIIMAKQPDPRKKPATQQDPQPVPPEAVSSEDEARLAEDEAFAELMADAGAALGDASAPPPP